MKDQTALRRVFGVFCVISLAALLILAVGCKIKLDEGQTAAPDQEGGYKLNKVKPDQVEGGRNRLSSYLRKKESILYAAVEIEGKEFDVYLGIKHPGEFTILPKVASDDKAPKWWGMDALKRLHLINGKYYSFSKNKSQDRLFVNEYSGQFGKLVAGKGGRDITGIKMRGSLQSEDISVAIRPSDGVDGPEYTSDCMLPVGDYRPASMSFNYGRVGFSVFNNSHNDVQGRSINDRPEVYGIKIRRDKPFILDFSNKPAVAFTLPAKDQRFKVGAEIEVKALIIDPKLDIMFLNLYETETDDNGKSKCTILHPKIVITRADGTEVTSGPMPFVCFATCEYSWRVPTDLEISGKEEAFNIQVQYKTLDLYGDVNADQKIVIYRD
jgi:hypothetical protein